MKDVSLFVIVFSMFTAALSMIVPLPYKFGIIAIQLVVVIIAIVNAVIVHRKHKKLKS